MYVNMFNQKQKVTAVSNHKKISITNSCRFLIKRTDFSKHCLNFSLCDSYYLGILVTVVVSTLVNILNKNNEI